MLKELKNQTEGVIFVTVLMVVIVMTILTITIVGMNMNQILASEKEVKRIQSELLAQGALSLMVINQLSDSSSDTILYNETLNGASFDVIIDVDDTDAGTFSTNDLTVTVNY